MQLPGSTSIHIVPVLWKVFFYTTGIAAAVIGTGILIVQSDRPLGVVAFLALIAITFIAVGALAIVSAHIRVTMSPEGITSQSILGTRSLKWHEIAGYSFKPSTLVVSPQDSGKKKIEIWMSLREAREIFAVLEQNFVYLRHLNRPPPDNL